MSTGLRKPSKAEVGADFAGEVVEVGAGVTGVKVGDKVFGETRGSFAQYCLAPEKTLAIVPDSLTMEEAAALPVAGATALKMIRDHGSVTEGTKVAVVGAGGGVGSFAVQIAKALGATVTAVTSTAKVAAARAMGADAVVDYKTDDVCKGSEVFDVVMDAGAYRSPTDYVPVLTPRTGTYLMVGGSTSNMFGVMLGGWWSFGVRHGLTAKAGEVTSTHDLLSDLATLADEGKLRPVIDRTISLDQVPDAVQDLKDGKCTGKIVVKIDHEE
jgi:NADPH:quinone reductase-like Zn-dependent oxidoreductase